MRRLLPYVTLLSSVGTLLCCALPALFVSLGMGAAVAATVATVPQLVWLSERKGLVFLIAGGMILVSGVYRAATRNAPCPVDPQLRDACITGRKVSSVMFWISAVVYLVGASFAYLAPILFF